MNDTTTNNQCSITGTLAVYSAWGANQNSTDPDQAKLRDIQHLFNRMTLGANRMDIEWALNKTPAQVVDRLVDLATEQINGTFTVPPPGLGIHKWGDKFGAIDYEMQQECSSPYWRKMALKREWANGLIGNNNPLNPIYTPSNGTKTVLDQEIDRAKRFKYKMSWFWSNHFVVDEDSSDYGNSLMWYKYILVHNALGNFKEFTKDIGLCQGMLKYLDAGLNYYKGDPSWVPNENYARELLELFTMGVADGSPDDYTLNDIIEIAKVFSGWRNDRWSANPPLFREFVFQPVIHDWNTKTIFGVTYTPTPDPGLTLSPHQTAWSQNLGLDPNSPGASCDSTYAYIRYEPLTDHPHCFKGDRNTYEIKDAYDEYEKIHEIIFGDFTGPEPYNQGNMNARKDRIAKFICTKIYKNFVVERVDASGETIINDLATIFKTNWELAPVMRTLFKSEYFFNAQFRGAQIKSQLGSFFGLLTTGPYEFNSDYFFTKHFFSAAHYDAVNDPFGYEVTSIPFNGDVSRTTYGNIQWYCYGLGHILFRPPNVSGFPGFRKWIGEFSFLKLGKELGSLALYGFSDTRISTQFKVRDFLVDISNNSSDPEVITREVAKHFVLVDLLPEQIDSAVIAFKWTIPANYFDDGLWNLNYDINWTYRQYTSLVSFLVRQPEFFMS